MGEFYETFKEDIMSILCKLFQTSGKKWEHFPTNFMKPALLWYQTQINVLWEQQQ